MCYRSTSLGIWLSKVRVGLLQWLVLLLKSQANLSGRS